ncbi:MAG: TIGR03364 family FAD-dependent oxidoreductase [Actinomycetota bacterium]|nr:TIGR03364 family FAD-dependent oxidoreductase [Actinomycetota bacterium]
MSASPSLPRLVVVGGGILGTMHALAGVRRGFSVTQLERDEVPRGASVRNFGLIWVGGRAPGAELELALAARERWEAIAAAAPAAGFRSAGSLTLARRPEELAVLEAAVELEDAKARGFSLCSRAEAMAIEPALRGDFLAALHCAQDAIVEPRLALSALRSSLQASGRYRYRGGCEIVELGDHHVVDATRTRHDADLVVCCPGASPAGALAEALAGAPLRRVRLQMLETAPFASPLASALADGDSLRYYPAYAGPPREALGPQAPVPAAWTAQLLMVKRLAGHLTIGDTHQYVEPFPFDLCAEPEQHLVEVAARLLATALPPIERRWAGIYSEVTDPALLYYRAELASGVVVVTGPGGRGMTLSPAIAEETFA